MQLQCQIVRLKLFVLTFYVKTKHNNKYCLNNRHVSKKYLYKKQDMDHEIDIYVYLYYFIIFLVIYCNCLLKTINHFTLYMV